MRLVLRSFLAMMKITENVQGGDYNAFVGDNGNYPERHDVMIVGNHHAVSGCHIKSLCSSWKSLHFHTTISVTTMMVMA